MSKSQGRRFAETLVDSGLVKKVTMSEILLIHNARLLIELSRISEPVSVSSTDVAQSHPARFGFSLDNLAAAAEEIVRSKLLPTGTETAPLSEVSPVNDITKTNFLSEEELPTARRLILQEGGTTSSPTSHR